MMCAAAPGQDRNNGVVIPAGLGLVGHTAVCGEVVNCVNPYDDARFHASERIAARVRSALYVPVVDSAGAVRGVLVAANKQVCVLLEWGASPPANLLYCCSCSCNHCP